MHYLFSAMTMRISSRTASLSRAAASRVYQRAAFASCSAGAPSTRSPLQLQIQRKAALPVRSTVGSCNTSHCIPISVAIAPSIRFRAFATLMPEEDVKKRLEEFQELFVEARYCIEDCTDAAESTYFDEEAETAKEAVAAAVTAFESLIGDMDDTDQKNGILRSNGLKVEQLKGELQMALNGGH
mmetsp:Transcript_34607/g.83685  ORF Transcript_34607/g.83685 Transcript_34607/m.83685 type:complete len:184 (-) Transcript_34607:386-937(-)